MHKLNNYVKIFTATKAANYTSQKISLSFLRINSIKKLMHTMFEGKDWEDGKRFKTSSSCKFQKDILSNSKQRNIGKFVFTL